MGSVWIQIFQKFESRALEWPVPPWHALLVPDRSPEASRREGSGFKFAKNLNPEPGPRHTKGEQPDGATWRALDSNLKKFESRDLNPAIPRGKGPI